MTTNPKIGIYDGIDFEHYRGWEAVNASRLKLMGISPAHYLRAGEHGQSTSSRALSIGSIVHCAALEPDTINDRYRVMPTYHLDDQNLTKTGQPTMSKNTAYYRRRAEAFKKKHPDCEIVTQDIYDQVQAIMLSLQRAPDSMGLLQAEGKSEVSIRWDDPDTGTPCKGRIDRQSGKRLIDIKTTRSLSDFATQIARLKYHMQLAHYQAGWQALTGDLPEVWIIAIENEQPHCVHAARLSDDALEDGEKLRREYLHKLVSCQQSRTWPGPSMPSIWELPEWATTQATESLITADL